MKKIYLKSGKEESLKRFHPWIFSGAIAQMEGHPQEGEVVSVYTSNNIFLAKGHFQIGSIAVRVLSFQEKEELGLALESCRWLHTILKSLDTE